MSVDGLNMYVTDTTNDQISQYSLSEAWNSSNTTYVRSFSVSSEDNDPRGLFFRDDGLKFYFTGGQNDFVYEYDLSTAWDISTATFNQSLNVSATDNGLDRDWETTL